MKKKQAVTMISMLILTGFFNACNTSKDSAPATINVEVKRVSTANETENFVN